MDLSCSRIPAGLADNNHLLLYATIKIRKLPSGERLERIKKSPNYKNGKFVNQVPRSTLSEGYTMMGVAYTTFFKKFERRYPTDSIPSVKTDLKALPADTNLAVWFGHSSVYLQLSGKKILIDPVFSSNASPIRGFCKSVQRHRGIQA